MSNPGNATEVERNSIDKEKSSGDKSESLKRPVSELNDTGKEDSKQKLQKTDKDEKSNGDTKHKEEEDEDDIDSKDEDDDVGGEGEGEDFDEEEGEEDGGEDEAEDDDEDEARRFVEWAQNEIAVVPDFHKRILFSDEAYFWLNGYVNKQNCRNWSEANPQVYVETPLHPEKLTVWCALWAGEILQKRRRPQRYSQW
ncbi:uncharacterized protein TNCV_518301 [Trichonephila clavipes]|nr:uncharacterized protein TNCV_518301 [Trichonephila clavipes]